MNIKIVLGGSVLISLTSGAAVGYLFAKKQLEAKYEKMLSEELEATRAHYNILHKRNDFSTPEGAAQTLGRRVPGQALTNEGGMENLPSDFRPSHPPVAVLEKVIEGLKYKQYDKLDDAEAYTTEGDSGRDVGPYVISVEEFGKNENGYTQLSLTYYAGDDVLCEEDETVMPEGYRDQCIGEEHLDQFGRQSKNPMLVHVRNDQLQIDYEIVRHDGNYAELVHGIFNKKQNSKNMRKFPIKE